MNRFIGAALASVALASTVSAQDVTSAARSGFGISFGFGNGSAAMSCDNCISDRENGLSGYLRMGGFVSPSLFVGGESSGWVKNSFGVDQQIGTLNAVLQWYPQPSGGLFLKGGAGIAHATANDGFDELTTTGGSFVAGAGYDWNLRGSFSLTPYANYVRSIGAEAQVNGFGTGYSLNVDVLQFGLGFSWH